MSFWSDNRFSAAINKQLVCLGLAGGAESRRMLWLTAAYALIYILVASCCRPAECIRMTRVHAESDSSRVEALLGSNITLRCPFELEGNDQLYSIKWHKKLNGTFFEFYSYISSPHETIHHKALPGIRVDLSESIRRTGQEVKLLKVDLETEGSYSCAATTDEIFQVVRQELSVAVLILAEQAPIIQATRRTYGIGERVQLTCTAGPSRPIAQIKWLINDVPVPQSYIRPTRQQVDPNRNASATCAPELSLTQNERSLAAAVNDTWLDGRQSGPATSQLDFILRHEHLSELGHFTVSCMSQMSTQFIPEVRNSTVELGVWPASTPVIVGLQEEYDLGDWIHLNCTVPAFQTKQSNRLKQSSKIEWYINGQRAQKKWLVHYFTYGHIGLRFQLEPHHLADDESLSIKCVSIQMWPVDEATNRTVHIESLEEANPRREGKQRPLKKGHRKTTRPPKPTKPTLFVVVGLRDEKRANSTPTEFPEKVFEQQTETPTTSTEPSVEPDEGTASSPYNETDSMLHSIRQLGARHPQLVTSVGLTLIPIAVVGALFALL